MLIRPPAIIIHKRRRLRFPTLSLVSSMRNPWQTTDQPPALHTLEADGNCGMRTEILEQLRYVMVLLAPQTRLWKCMWTVVGLCGFVVVRAYTVCPNCCGLLPAGAYPTYG
jgi:hypothetical protein